MFTPSLRNDEALDILIFTDLTGESPASDTAYAIRQWLMDRTGDRTALIILRDHSLGPMLTEYWGNEISQILVDDPHQSDLKKQLKILENINEEETENDLKRRSNHDGWNNCVNIIIDGSHANSGIKLSYNKETDDILTVNSKSPFNDRHRVSGSLLEGIEVELPFFQLSTQIVLNHNDVIPLAQTSKNDNENHTQTFGAQLNLFHPSEESSRVVFSTAQPFLDAALTDQQHRIVITELVDYLTSDRTNGYQSQKEPYG